MVTSGTAAVFAKKKLHWLLGDSSSHRGRWFEGVPDAVHLFSGYRRTSNYWIASWAKTSVFRGTSGFQRSILGPTEILKEHLSFCRHHLSSLMFVDLLESTIVRLKSKVWRLNITKFKTTIPSVYWLGHPETHLFLLFISTFGSKYPVNGVRRFETLFTLREDSGSHQGRCCEGVLREAL